MKKVGIFIFAAALVVGLVASNLFSFGRFDCSNLKFSLNFGKGVRGSGNVVTQKRAVSGFTSVETGGIFEVTIVLQKDFDVEVQADDNLIPLINTEVRDGVLHIDSERRFRSASPIRIRISAPDIDRLEVSGVSNVSMSGIANSGLNVEASGASKITLSGETSKMGLDISGASKIYAESLRATSANIDASGAVQANVNVTNEIRSDLSGASRVTYTGSPSSVVTHQSGVSSISAK